MNVPLSVQWKAINLIQLRDRSDEEEVRIRDDMKSAVDYFCTTHAALLELAASSSSVSLKARIFKKVMVLEKTMTDLWQVVSKYITNMPDIPFITPIDLSSVICDIDGDDAIDLNELTSTLTASDDCELDSDSDSDSNLDE